ncbi:hypothetical protein M427DRAFT_54471 [Gonapodya prolifera JEL478]|uniref:Uncharacterized protein n=1 Tax=Gonapodya prolifera (strain JEL478) TaxID=1344416 RepID=A0A139ALT6_GONPJ|nr:hypothetical protein M427DRAFT_54471 [Gonapodya prolifera JEL478]|eukprot:KXS17524.1 hypothetical protein M427DRAFT_54471 [Gonapodya prolifera JEL478]
MCERVGQILDRIAELEATTIRELAQVESEWKQLIIAFPPGKQETAPLGERFRSCDRSDLTHSNDQIRSALEDARRRATETLSRIL